MGDLKLVEPPQNYSLAPETSMQIKAIIKALSTESGVIFGNMVYETSNVTERNVVVLNDIYIDIMDYIFPNVCSGVASRTTCAEFDSENKVVAEETSILDEKLLDHALKCTKFMKYLIVTCVQEGKCGFRTANSYAASVFPKDDTNVFLGLKKQPDGEVIGSISMCRKTPEIATSLRRNSSSSNEVSQMQLKNKDIICIISLLLMF